MDKQEMSEVYKENALIVYKYLVCLTHNVDLAEELTQETFYQAMKGINRFRGECKLSVWLCQIAKRLWYKELNSQKRRLIPLDEVNEELISDDDMEGNFLAGVEKLEIFRLMHHLEPQVKEVLYLRLSGDLSFAQIGDIMGKTEIWARVTFYRGKQSLMKGREKWNEN